jgi:hypothetical protein
LRSLPVGAAVPQEGERVVGEVPESVPDPLDLLDQQVDGFGGPVGDTVGVEVGQQLTAPGVDCAGEANQLMNT